MLKISDLHRLFIAVAVLFTVAYAAEAKPDKAAEDRREPIEITWDDGARYRIDFKKEEATYLGPENTTNSITSPVTL